MVVNKKADISNAPRRRSGNPNPVNKGKGRPKGVPNKITAIVKEAVIAAAERTGDIDNKNKGGLTGYLEWAARHEAKSFIGLVAKVMPTQITGEDGKAITINVNGADASLL